MGFRKVTIITTVSILAIAAVAVVGAFTYRSVSAQATTPTPVAPSTDEAAPQDDAAPREKGLRMRVEVEKGAMQEDLAAALGIDVATLEAAQQTAAKQALAQAVEKGLITQDQADRLLERGAGHLGKFAPGKLEINGIDYDALLADALNINVDELNAAREEAFATALNRAVSEGTLTQEQADLIQGQKALFGNEGFQASMQSSFEASVRQAVTDGVITQAQADAILQSVEARGGLFERGGMFGREFRGRGFGGRHGGRDGGFPFPPSESPAAEPTTDA